MDAPRFDRLAKALATGASRRQAVRGLTAGLAALGGAALGWERAGAQGIADGFTGPTLQVSDRSCRGERAFNNRVCPQNRCGDNRFCVCGKTEGGDKRCVNVNRRCPRQDECDGDRACARGEVCVKAGGCCGRNRNACVRLCR